MVLASSQEVIAGEIGCGPGRPALQKYDASERPTLKHLSGKLYARYQVCRRKGKAVPDVGNAASVVLYQVTRGCQANWVIVEGVGIGVPSKQG